MITCRLSDAQRCSAMCSDCVQRCPSDCAQDQLDKLTQAHTAIIRANESLAGRNGGKAGPVIVRNGKSAKAKAKNAKSGKGKPAPPR